MYESGKLESEYIYDNASNEIEIIFYSNSGSVMGRREYEYDESGNKIKTIYYNSDGSIESCYVISRESGNDDVYVYEYEYEYAYID